MKILQVHPFLKSESIYPAAGGMARVALDITRELARAGHEVQVYPVLESAGRRYAWTILPGKTIRVPPVMALPAGGDAAWLAAALLRLRPLPKGVKKLFFDSLALTGLRRAVESFQPDLIHNHLGNEPFPRLARALRLKTPIILTHHHDRTGSGFDMYRRIVFPSQAMLETAVAESGFPRERTRVIHNPVRSTFIRGEVPPQSERSDIYFVGLYTLPKGVDLLIDVYRTDAEARKHPLHMCGAGKQLPMLEEAIRRDNLPIVCEGMLAPEILAARLSRARVVVNPSRSECFSVALVEALCCGTPVVGWAPQVRELESALQMPVGAPFNGSTQTAAELAEAIHAALTGPYTREGYREGLAQAARRAFSAEEFLRKYLAVYRELL